MFSFKIVKSVRKIGFVALLLVYLTSTMWISVFHAHSSIQEESQSVFIDTLSFSDDLHSDIEDDESICVYCQFLTHQNHTTELKINIYPVDHGKLSPGHYLYTPQSVLFSTSERAPPAPVSS